MRVSDPLTETTMPRSDSSRSRLALALALSTLACAPWPEFPEDGCEAESCESTTTGGPATASITLTHTGGDPSGSDSGTGTSVGTDSTSGSDSGPDTDAPTTEGADVEPPIILDVTLTPTTVTKNGEITVDVTTSENETEGVRLRLDDGTTRELTQTRPGHFTDKIYAYTGLDNGPHAAKLIPWRGDTDGAQVKEPYTVSLPQPSTEIYWEAADSLAIGQGWVAAMGTLPSGEIVELGTRVTEDDKRRCYLRLRTDEGAWGSPNIVHLLPGDECEAVDLVVREDGTIHTLVAWRIAPNSWGWWLSDIPTWDSEPLTLAAGPAGEDATALAYRDGQLAVCGSAPSGFGDLDLFVDVVGDEQPRQSVDYISKDTDPNTPHKFDEIPRDCLFTGDNEIAVVGEAYGEHEKDAGDHSRRFLLSVDVETPTAPNFAVAKAGFASQSIATAVVLDDFGNLLVAGYVCGEPCVEAEGFLWTLSTEGDELSSTALGLFSEPLLAPHALHWSPAGYALVGNGGNAGDDDSFVVRAFAPGDGEPLWTYSRHDEFQTHVPMVIEVGDFGEIYAGGLGANVYPAIAYIAG